MNDSRDFQDAESVRSGYSLVTSRPVSFPPHPIHEGMLSRSLECRAAQMGRQVFGTRMISGNVFANPDASSTAPYPQELHQWNSSMEEPLHSSTVEKSERQEQNRDLRSGISEPIHSSTAEKSENRTQVQDQTCQSGPSAINSVIPSEGVSLKNYGADQRRLQISDLHFVSDN